jgi:hypothetical protein
VLDVRGGGLTRCLFFVNDTTHLPITDARTPMRGGPPRPRRGGRSTPLAGTDQPSAFAGVMRPSAFARRTAVAGGSSFGGSG